MCLMLMFALPCALDAHLVASNHHILAGETILLLECLVLQRTVMKWRCCCWYCLGHRIGIHWCVRLSRCLQELRQRRGQGLIHLVGSRPSRLLVFLLSCCRQPLHFLQGRCRDVLLLCWRLDVHITIVKYMHVLLLTYFTHIPHRSSLPSNTKLLTINLHSISCLHHCHHRIQLILWIIVDHLYFSAWILLHFVWIFLWSVVLRQLTILMTVHHCFGIV